MTFEVPPDLTLQTCIRKACEEMGINSIVGAYVAELACQHLRDASYAVVRLEERNPPQPAKPRPVFRVVGGRDQEDQT